MSAAINKRKFAIIGDGTPGNNLTRIEVSESDKTAITTAMYGLIGGNRIVYHSFRLLIIY